MRGEGEETFLELLKYYHGDVGGLDRIDGITYRNQEQNTLVEMPCTGRVRLAGKNQTGMWK